MKSALVTPFVLIRAGFVGTFPLFFEVFRPTNDFLLRRSGRAGLSLLNGPQNPAGI